MGRSSKRYYRVDIYSGMVIRLEWLRASRDQRLGLGPVWIQVVFPIVLFVPRVSIALIACFSSALLLFGFVPIKVR